MFLPKMFQVWDHKGTRRKNIFPACFPIKYRYIDVEIYSAGFQAGDFAEITINEVPIHFEKNSNGNFRGLYLVVINPFADILESA